MNSYKKIIVITLLIISGISFLFKKEKPVHIFFEMYATTPAFLEMAEFIKLPKTEPKIFAWHRFPQRENIFNLKEYNATEISIPAREGVYNYAPTFFIQNLLKELEKYPNSPLILYSNINQTEKYLIPLLQKLPKKRIEKIHLYEDGMCQFIGPIYDTQAKRRYNSNTIFQLNQLVTYQKGNFQQLFLTTLQKLYSVTYHFCHAETILKDNNLKFLTEWIGKENIQDVSLNKIAQSLTCDQKKAFASFIGLDFNKFDSLMKNKKTIVFTTGFLFGKKTAFEAQMNILHKLKKGVLKNFNPDGYQFFYKPHPSYSASNMEEYMSQNFPEMILIPAQIPLEAFFIVGLSPDIVAGYGSSLFFVIPKDKIGYYIHHGAYTNPLQRLGQIKKDQILYLKDFEIQK